MAGRFCRLEPLNSYRHLTDLCEAYTKAHDGREWTYMSGGSFADRADLDRHIVTAKLSQDPLHFAVVDLAPDNFDAHGRQHRRLAELRGGCPEPDPAVL